METKHTTGPWVIDWNVARLDIFSSDTKVLVASLRRSALSEDIDEAARANARLIAAAPELLNALRELSDLVDLILSGDYTPDSFTTQPARAAIAKAEGK